MFFFVKVIMNICLEDDSLFTLWLMGFHRFLIFFSECLLSLRENAFEYQLIC